MAELKRRSPKGWGKYKKLDKGWADYVEREILADMLKTFPTSKGMTQKKVAQLLVNNGWIETLQRHTWRSARAAGLEIGYEEFKNNLLAQKMYDGKVVNSWKNSYVREVSKKMTNRIKEKTKTLNQRIAVLNKSKDLGEVSAIFKTVKNPPKVIKSKLAVLKANFDTLSESQQKKRLGEISAFVIKDIKEVQYKAVVVDTADKVNKFQGKRIAQDQFQRASNQGLAVTAAKSTVAVKGKPEAVVVGFWSLSPTHVEHYYPDGDDPCEIHAEHDAGYGAGSYVGFIPIPVKDSHFGCACSLRLEVMEKR